MAGDGWRWLGMARWLEISADGLGSLEIVGDECRYPGDNWRWPEIAGDASRCLEILGDGWKCQEMAGESRRVLQKAGDTLRRL